MPVRPTWACRGCEDPWPCEDAKASMLIEYEGEALSLSTYLAGCFLAARRDLPEEPYGTLHKRFLGWRRTEQRQ